MPEPPAEQPRSSIDGLEPLPPLPYRAPRRTWPQRLVLGFNVVVAMACLVSAFAILYANNRLGSRRLVDISSAAPQTTVPQTAPASIDPTASSTATTEPLPIVPAGDVGAKNFLLTASDARACIDPNSPDAGSYLGSGADIGERADTIMMLRIDPATDQAAVLSFPRDLWVRIGTSNRKSRINSSLDANDPGKLIATILTNFGLPVDHLINVDFCAFKGLVDAVGGVAVPFQFAARDRATGLDIPVPECHLFDGDEALRYVRSRKYQYFDPEQNEWVSDGTSDLGRITRQQDFLKRTLQKALDKGARDLRVANRLIDAALQYVITDANLTVDVMLQVANAMKDFDPATVKTFQIDGRPRNVSGNSVLEPVIDSDNMRAVLAVFRGEARIADAPDAPELTPTDPSVSATTAPATTVGGGTSTTAPSGSTSTTAPGTTLPVVEVEENITGLYPPRDLTCR
jgi:LCP family protein required for cell wall assembly